MQRHLSFLIVLAIPFASFGQALYNEGATVSVKSGATLYVAGNTTVASGTVNNSGNFCTTGNLTNNGTVTAPSGSTLFLQGTATQMLSGSQPVNATNVVVNNAAGITLNTPLQVDGSISFTSGIVTASSPASPLVLTTNGTVSGTPSDASHVAGYVKKLGTGSFTFPVGSAAKYQPVSVNLSANGSGLTAFYTAGNAGSGTLTAGGTEAAPLTNYNANEYWDLSPAGSATGTVTVYWDDVNDNFPYSVTGRRVAHKVGGAWLNEGGTGLGTSSAGSITSNNISAWGQFTLGSVGFALPVKWVAVSGTFNPQNKATLQWSVEEQSVKSYVVEKSFDGIVFTSISTIKSKGDGRNNYLFTEAAALNVTAYYRITQTENNGRFSYSSVLKLSTNKDGGVTLFPHPAINKLLVSLPASLLQTEANLLSLDGQKLQTITVQSNVFTLDVSHYNPGVYLLRFANGRTEKIIKQ